MRWTIPTKTAALTFCTVLYWLFVQSPYPTAETALQAFYGGEPRPECMQADPLRWHGSRVVPLVIRDLPNKAIPKRRYAIGFLGEGRYTEALPVLESIVFDESEKFYFRIDALQAIYEIAPSHAQRLASRIVLTPQVEDRYGHLEKVVKSVLSGTIRIDHGCD